MVNANAILDGKAKNVHCVTMNAKYQIATGTGTALTENARASGVTRASSAARSTARTRRAPATASVSKDRVFARRAGREPIARQWTRTHCNAFRIVLGMGLLMWTHKLALVIQDGPERTVLKVCVFKFSI